MSTNKQFYVTLRMKKSKEADTPSLPPVVILKENILYLNIKESVLTILPKLELGISDVGGLLEQVPMVDNDVITITIAKTKEEEPMLECDFIISDFNADVSNENKINNINIAGYLHAEDMFVPYRARAFSDNTLNILKTISEESGQKIKFSNPHDVNPIDTMYWYQDSNNFDFIKHLVQRSYIPEDTMFSYVNTSNEFVCTSLFTEMDKQEAYSVMYSHRRADRFYKGDDIIYYDSYDIQNLQGVYNKKNAYGSGFVEYNLQGGVNSELPYPRKKMTELYNKDKIYDEMLVFKNSMGATKSNPNVYENYSRAMTQNTNLRYDFFAQNISITADGMSPVKLFDKVNITIPSPTEGGTGINDVYSGHYLVTDISHTLTGNSTYRKFLVLSRNGINKSSVKQEYTVN